MTKIQKFSKISSVLKKIIDNRWKTVPTAKNGFPLIATNCIKHSSIFPTLENIRYVNHETLKTWFRASLEPNDILFVNKGTPGRCCLVPNPVTFCAAQDMIAFRCDENIIDYKYLFAILRSKFVQQKVANFHVWLAIPHFKKGDLDNIVIPRKPKREEERKIWEIYFNLSKKIELNNKINTELETMAKTLYDYWFVQFDFPDKNGKPYKSSGGEMEWNEELKREIPKGWEVKNIWDLINVKRGKNITRKTVVEWNIPVIAAWLKPSCYHNTSNTDSPVVTISGSGANAWYIHLHNQKIWASDCSYIDPTMFGQIYFIYLFLQKRQNEIYDMQKWSAQPHVYPQDIMNIQIETDKNLELFSRFEKTINPIYKKIGNNQKENQKLAELRDFLLPMLMNGQVVVE